MLHQKKDSDLADARKIFLKLIENGQKNFAQFLTDKDSAEYKAIINVLNAREFVACGIREKAYDGKLYKRMQYSVVIRDWNALCGFVVEFRKSKDQNVAGTFYQDFEWLAGEWQKYPLRPVKSSRWSFWG